MRQVISSPEHQAENLPSDTGNRCNGTGLIGASHPGRCVHGSDLVSHLLGTQTVRKDFRNGDHVDISRREVNVVTCGEVASKGRKGSGGRSSGQWVYVIGPAFLLLSEFILRDVLLPDHPTDTHIGITIAVEWLVLVALVAFWIPRVEGQTLSGIGLGEFRLRYLWVGLLGYLVLLVALAGANIVQKVAGLEGLRSLQPTLKQLGLPVRLGLFLTGPILEEILYRGYLIERATLVTGRRWLAAGLSWLLFTLVHLKWVGVGPLLEMTVLSAALVTLYLRERSIWPCMILHGINSTFAYILGPLLIP